MTSRYLIRVSHVSIGGLGVGHGFGVRLWGRLSEEEV